MDPQLHRYDLDDLYLMFAITVDSYEVGQIAAYDGSGHGLEVPHRITGGGARTGFVFKGATTRQLTRWNPPETN